MLGKNLTLKIGSKACGEYKAYHKHKRLIISKQFENFIKKEPKKNNKVFM